MTPQAVAASEKAVERYLVQQVRSLKGTAYKFTSPGRTGVPDRMCLFPDGRMLFVELKGRGKKAKTYQEREHARLRKLGFVVEVANSKKCVDLVLERFIEGDK